jgi:hypothetical protein
MTYDLFAKFAIRYQQYLYYPILTSAASTFIGSAGNTSCSVLAPERDQLGGTDGSSLPGKSSGLGSATASSINDTYRMGPICICDGQPHDYSAVARPDHTKSFCNEHG